MGSNNPLSRKPSADEWEKLRDTIIRLYVDEGQALSAIQDRLREDHDFPTTQRTFKSKLKAWGIRKYTPSKEMGAILQDLIRTHPTDLTQRTGTKIVSVNGRLVAMAHVKRYIRRKGLPTSHAEPWSDTRASQSGPALCSLAPVPLLADAMEKRPHVSGPHEKAWQSILQRSNYMGLYPLHQPFGTEDPHLCHFMFHDANATGQKRTWASASDDQSIPAEERQPKRQRSRQQTSTCNNLACPFYKNNPSYYNPQNPDAEAGRKYRCCAGPGWTNIRQLREHLLRAHESDFYERPVREQLGRIEKGLSEAQHWMKIYSLLFPSAHCSQTPSPYYDCEFDLTFRNQHVSEDGHGEIQSFISHLHAILPSRIREELVKQMSGPDQVPFYEAVDSAVRNSLNQTRSEWHQAQDAQSVEQQDSTCHSWDNDPSTNWLSYPSTPSSGLDRSLSLAGLDLDYLTPKHLNEPGLPSCTWASPLPNGNAEPASIEAELRLYESAELLDYSSTSTTSDMLTWDTDALQWASGGLHEAINFD